LSYNFGEIEYPVRKEIHTTSARFNATLDELRSHIAPLQQLWTREAAAAAKAPAEARGKTKPESDSDYRHPKCYANTRGRVRLLGRGFPCMIGSAR
jgi:hypothetical protein